MKVEYYIFSGTGNTLMIAREVGKRLEEKGCNVSYHMMDKRGMFKMPGECVIGLAFPIAFFSSYPLVLDFIASLPQGKGKKIFMTGTMGGAAMGAEGKFRRMVADKGYVPVGSELFIMPGNYNNTVIPAEKNEKLIETALKEARSFADSLIEGTARWNRGAPIIPSLWQWFVTSGRALRFFYKMFPIAIDNDKCIKCMRCMENCPVGAIDKNSESLFIYPDRCQSCQRCVAFCPVHAVIVPGKPAEQYRAMDFEEFIKNY
jgi:NAD-dependent dihydropyrimidine dehydrogenase PreA subunit/flavodoxin